jgi:hypothetical protein
MSAVVRWAVAALTVAAAWAQCGVMPWDEYRTLRHSTPYVLRFDGLVMYGVQHARDPQHTEMAEIERLWREFRPELAFSEGGLWRLAPTRDEAIERYGEQGLLRWLADRDHVEIRSMEPERGKEQAALTEQFGEETVRRFFAQRATIDPVHDTGVMAEIMRRDGDLRNCHMIPLIVEAVRSGKRVFVVVGATHVVMQEKALRSALAH